MEQELAVSECLSMYPKRNPIESERGILVREGYVTFGQFHLL